MAFFQVLVANFEPQVCVPVIDVFAVLIMDDFHHKVAIKSWALKFK